MGDLRLYLAILLVFSFALLDAQQPAATSCVIGGKVFDIGTGAPVQRARIKLMSEERELYARTDSEGRFRIDNAPLDFYHLWAEGPGYERNVSQSSFDLRASGADKSSEPCCAYVFHPGLPAGSFSLSTDAQGIRHAQISVPLLANVVISGRVADQDGLPLQGYAVETIARRPAGLPLPPGEKEFGTMGPIDHTDDRGEFRIARPFGSYYVAVNKPEFLGLWEDGYRVTYYPHATDQASAKLLELAPGQQVRLEMQIVVQKGARVAGRLVLPVGVNTRRLYTRVMLVPVQSETAISRGLATNGKEDYEFKEVPPGKYDLLAFTGDGGTDVMGGNQTFTYGHMRALEVGDGDMAGVDVPLQPLRDLPVTATFRGCAPTRLRVSALNESPMQPPPSEGVTEH